jgi:hypothetical protein
VHLKISLSIGNPAALAVLIVSWMQAIAEYTAFGRNLSKARIAVHEARCQSFSML